MRENLDSRAGAGDIVWFAVLGTDVVLACHGLVATQSNIGKVGALLGEVEGEDGSIIV